MSEGRWEKQLKECNKKSMEECEKITCEKCEMLLRKV